MFHPYWAEAGPDGTFPRDMAFRPDHEDKARLRQLYHEFLSDHYGLNNHGEPAYPVPADDYAGNDDTAGATNNGDGQSLFIPEDGQGPACGSKDGQPKKKRSRPANPDGPKKRQSRKRISNRDAGLAVLFPDADKMIKQDERPQYALNDGDSVKSESRATSVTAQLQNGLLLSTPPDRHEHPIGLDASPGRNIFNVITLDEFEGQLEVQNAQFPSGQCSSNPSQVINLADDYVIHLEAERQETDRASEEILEQCGVPAQRNASAAARTSNSPQLSSGRLRDSIEIDENEEQDAQVVRRGSSDTLVATNDHDLQIIEQLDVNPDMEEIEIDVDTAVVLAESATVATAISLD
jgi:hypothetical protein